MQIYGEKLKEIRCKTGISVKYIMTQLNISRKTYWNWESGKVTPTWEKIKDLAKLLNVSISIISDLTDKEFSDQSFDKILASIPAKRNNKDHDANIFTSVKDYISIIQKQDIYKTAIIEMLLNSINCMFYVKDQNLKYALANDLFIQNVTGSVETLYLNKTDKNIFSHAEAAVNTAEDNNVLITGKPITKIEKHIPGTKKKKFGLISKYPVLDENSKIMGVIASFIDITDRKNNENRRIILENIINKIEEVVWFWDLNSTNKEKFYINSAAEKITGIKTEEFYKDPYVTYKHCHPDFKKRLEEFFHSEKRPFEIEYKLIRPTDKAEIWIRQISYQEENLKFGIGYDITEHKENEEIKDLLKLYIDSAKHGISVSDLETGQFIYMNKAASVIYGRPVEEMMDNGYMFWLNNCVYGKDKEFFKKFKTVDDLIAYNLLNKTLKYKIIRPDGKIRSIICETSIIEFKGKQCALYVEYDITELKLPPEL